MNTKVTNLYTGEEQFYSCHPVQAVKSAFALANNQATQLACGTLNVKVDYGRINPNGKQVISCGDWASIIHHEKGPYCEDCGNHYNKCSCAPDLPFFAQVTALSF